MMKNDRILIPPRKEGFGIELEFILSEDYFYKAHHDRNNKKFSFLNKLVTNDYCEIKDDSSCGGEITLGIFDLSPRGINNFIKILRLLYHDARTIRGELESKIKKECRKYNDNFSNYINAVYEGRGNYSDCFDIGEDGHIVLLNLDCGLHVHVSQSLFPNDQCIERFFTLFGFFEKDIFKYCTHGSRAGNEYAYSVSKKLRNGKFTYDDIEDCAHYHCINLSDNWGTIEIRHSGMTSNIQTIKNWLLLIHFFYRKSLSERTFLPLIQKKSLRKLFPNDSRLSTWIKSTSSDKFSYDFK